MNGSTFQSQPLPELAEQLRGGFERTFGARPDGVWMAPGRVNLMGEHTDYNEGFVLPFAIDRRAAVAVAMRPAQRMARLFSAQAPGIIEINLDTLAPAQDYGWARYPLGVVWAMERSGFRLPGFELYLDSSVPSGAGLSSSHAIECATILALAELSGAPVGLDDLISLTQLGENGFVGAPTGILDQSASLRGSRGHALFLDCRDQHSELIPFRTAEASLSLLVIDTRVSHSHHDGGYAARRAACEAGAATLGVSSLRELGTDELRRAQDVLKETIFRRVRHVVTENERVLQLVELLRSSGPAAMGPLLDASHRSMRDDFEISCPELDLAVDTARAAGALGARMTGGGFGGSAIALIPAVREAAIRDKLTTAFDQAGFQAPQIFAVTPAEGASRIG